MIAPQLLAVVEVDESERVRCQAPGCGRPVYRRIHVVKTDDGLLQVMGEDCCNRLFGWDRTRPAPRLAGADGRRLTSAERAMLMANTEALLANLEDEIERRRREAAARVRRLTPPAPTPMPAPGYFRKLEQRPGRSSIFQPKPQPSPEVLAQAVRLMHERWQIGEQQALLPGWASELRDCIAEVERRRRP